MRTKMVCTIGPSVANVEKLKQLVEQGMNVARLNFSHGTHEEHLVTIKNLKAVREELKKPLALMLDTKGPEIRIVELTSNPIKVQPGSLLKIIGFKEQIPQNEPYLLIHPAEIIPHLKPGLTVMIDDGYIQGSICSNKDGMAQLKIDNSGEIKKNKSLNIPEADFHLPILSSQDVEDLRFGAEQDIDIVALSFVTTHEQVVKVRRLLNELNQPRIQILSKIESASGVKNFDAILSVSDGIMVARGDLGVELPIEKIPVLQKQFISKCLQAGKPVIVATQMLESMIKNPRPTRAEASDVAGAIFDAASAVMLSGETAVGAYPIETVKIMRKIGDETELACDFSDYFTKVQKKTYHHVSEAIACATVHAASMTGSRMIIVCTQSGETARQISKFRPQASIIAITADPKIFHQLSLTWGVIPILKGVKTMQEAVKVASEFGLKKGICRIGDLVVATSGALFGISGSTNLLAFENIGEVLMRGICGTIEDLVDGQVIVVGAKDKVVKEKIQGKIALIENCHDTEIQAIRLAKGVIVHNALDDGHALAFCRDLEQIGLPAVAVPDGALELLKNGDQVTIDSSRGLIFKGKLDFNNT
jgi:pyruvate kinase